MSALFLALALAAAPASFEAAFPGADRIQGPGRLSLIHASGFRAQGLGAAPETAARAFLERHGGSFGIRAEDSLVAEHASPAGVVGPVRFQRHVAGRPVFGGTVVVGVDAAGAVFLVNASEVPPRTGTRFSVSAASARAAATAALGARALVLGTTAPAAGWKPLLGGTRPAWQVEVRSASPAGEWRVWVDAETGRVLHRVDTRKYAQGRVFEISPSQAPGSTCPIEAGGLFAGAHSQCAPTVLVPLQNLTSGMELSGAQASAFNCLGRSALDTVSWRDPIDCVPVAPDSPAGAPTDWDFEPDLAGASPSDDFAAVMAYHHADRQWTYLRRLDPSTAWRLDVPVYLYSNLFSEGRPFANAFYTSWATPDGTPIGLVALGQALSVDLAYDAGVIYHEVTHGAIERHGGFGWDILPAGTFLEPMALHEGTADALAAAGTGSPLMGAYAARCLDDATCRPAPALRDLGEYHTCRGTGAPWNDFGLGVGSVDGLDGEVHDDGEIWGEFFWDLHQALTGFPACGGLCNAADLIQWRTVELTAGGAPSFRVYGRTAMAAAEALFPGDPRVRDLVSCTLGRHAMGDCDGTVPVHLGESKATLVMAYFSALQTSFEVQGTGVVRACDAVSSGGTWTTPPRLYFRRGSPVQLTHALIGASYRETTGVWDRSVDLPMPGCSDVALSGAGTWYMLADVPEADGSQVAVIWVSPTSGVSSRVAAPPAGACVLGGGPAPEICGNGFDDDGDGLTDCADPDCSAAGECQRPLTPVVQKEGGCSTSGSGGALALLALAGLVRRRVNGGRRPASPEAPRQGRPQEGPAPAPQWR